MPECKKPHFCSDLAQSLPEFLYIGISIFFSAFGDVSYLDRLVLPLVIATTLILLWVEETKV